MTTAVLPTFHSLAAFHPAPQLHGPLVVASDNSPQSDAAFPAAQAIADRLGCAVQVMSAISPLAMPMYGFDALLMPPEVDTAVREGREGMIRSQLARLLSPSVQWPVVVRAGDAAREIADFAQELSARVIVMGRGRHTSLHRALGGETVLRLLQLGDTPVLAAEAVLSSLPSRVVIATDFSEFSLYAARVGLSLVAPNARVFLVHVAPPFEDTDTTGRLPAVAYRNQALHALAEMRERLSCDGLTFEEVLVEGNPSDEVMRVTRARDADLIIAATHGYGFFRRMMLGSVAAELLRHAPCSVLCVPGSAQTLAASRLRSATVSQTHSMDMVVLNAELSAFIERNAGRSCTVEIDRLDIGAQIMGHALPLVGGSFDRAKGVVSLMFGASVTPGQHLAQSIAGVTSIDITTDAEGRERALCIVHPEGRTLLLLD